jgi:aminoglycoside phosphotransferase (APT) family kinase protein
MQISKRALERYLRERWGPDAAVRSFGPLGDVQARRALKGFGYGSPVIIEALVGGRARRMVLETMRPGPHGHEHMADRAHAMLWDYATYNRLPRHVRALDVGAFTASGRLHSVEDAREFFVLTEFEKGGEYQRDLARIARTGRVERQDLARARALADYLVDIHQVKKRAPDLYRRALRDLIGHGECLMGVVDSYPPTFSFVTPALLESIERRANAWRWRLRARTGRLSQVHGDYHPWNVLFRKGVDFSVLDRSRQEWGEPADDVTAMTINYLFCSLRRWGDLRGPFERLFRLFWDRYLEGTADRGVLEAAPPFFAFRGLVIASPVWYPTLDLRVRRALFNFIENVLGQPRFDPARVNEFLKGPSS